jgi:hypothetical protein
MSDITEERINIQNEEVAYKAAVSESTFTRVGSAVNFINKRQFDTKTFEINGPYKVAQAIDGAFIAPFDMEIIGVGAFNIVNGSSGTTTFNIRRFTASNTGGSSIFSTKPAISTAAGNNAYVARRLIPANLTLENPSGTTLPVISVVNIDAGDMLVCDIDTVQASAQNCGLVIWFRPR